jgi:hypothetical protein
MRAGGARSVCAARSRIEPPQPARKAKPATLARKAPSGDGPDQTEHEVRGRAVAGPQREHEPTKAA